MQANPVHFVLPNSDCLVDDLYFSVPVVIHQDHFNMGKQHRFRRNAFHPGPRTRLCLVLMGVIGWAAGTEHRLGSLTIGFSFSVLEAESLRSVY